MTFCTDQSSRLSELPSVLRSKRKKRSAVVRLPKGINSITGLIFLSSILFPRAQQSFKRDCFTLQKFLQFHQIESEMIFTFLCQSLHLPQCTSSEGGTGIVSSVTLLGQKLMTELVDWASSEFLAQTQLACISLRFGIFRPWWLKVKEHPDCGGFLFFVFFTECFLGIFILMV